MNKTSEEKFNECKRVHAKIRASIGWLATELKISNLVSVAAFFNRDAAALVRTIQRLLHDATSRDDLYQLKDNINKSISQACPFFL